MARHLVEMENMVLKKHAKLPFTIDVETSFTFLLQLLTTGCSQETANYKFVTALVVCHLESYGISAFFTDNGTF